MPPVRRILCILLLALPPAAHAGGVVVVSSSGASGLWLALAVWAGVQPRPVPEISPHHLSAPPPRAADSCTFVAGVRHCPLPRPRAESR
jgi:hypothetical protein